MDLNKIEELIKVLEGSRAEEISVKKGDVAVQIKKSVKARPAPGASKPKSGSVKGHVEPVEAPSADHYVLAPMVGVFRAADGILKVGSTVAAGQVVGAIESMKLLNDVVSNLAGNVTEVLVEDGTPVEYGQPLFRVEPA